LLPCRTDTSELHVCRSSISRVLSVCSVALHMAPTLRECQGHTATRFAQSGLLLAEAREGHQRGWIFYKLALGVPCIRFLACQAWGTASEAYPVSAAALLIELRAGIRRIIVYHTLCIPLTLCLALQPGHAASRTLPVLPSALVSMLSTCASRSRRRDQSWDRHRNRHGRWSRHWHRHRERSSCLYSCGSGGLNTTRRQPHSSTWTFAVCLRFRAEPAITLAPLILIP